jgi:hypothetical protein
MGGTIKVSSDGRNGSTFSFELPFVAPSEQQIKECVNNKFLNDVKRRDSGALKKHDFEHQKVLVAEVKLHQDIKFRIRIIL